jgi:hypothetical protein
MRETSINGIVRLHEQALFFGSDQRVESVTTKHSINIDEEQRRGGCYCICVCILWTGGHVG